METHLREQLQNALAFIRHIAADCREVSRSPGIDDGERRAWVSVSKRCERFVEKQEQLLLSSRSNAAGGPPGKQDPSPAPPAKELAVRLVHEFQRRLAMEDVPAIVAIIQQTFSAPPALSVAQPTLYSAGETDEEAEINRIRRLAGYPSEHGPTILQTALTLLARTEPFLKHATECPMDLEKGCECGAEIIREQVGIFLAHNASVAQRRDGK